MKTKEVNAILIGKKALDYCEKYAGTNKYNDIMLAIEFGYHLNKQGISREKYERDLKHCWNQAFVARDKYDYSFDEFLKSLNKQPR